MALNPPSGYDPWMGSTISTVTIRAMRFYRVFGGDTLLVGGWLTPTRPASASAARRELSLPPTNAATEYAEVWVPAGVRIQSGIAGPNWGEPGGGEQALVLQRIPPSCYGSPQPLPP